MAGIHRLKIDSDFLEEADLSRTLVEELFRTVDESISYRLEIPTSVTDANLPGLGSGSAAIATLQTLLFVVDTSTLFNFNGADVQMVVSTGHRRAAFIAYGISTTTVPHVTNEGTTTITCWVMAGGT